MSEEHLDRCVFIWLKIIIIITTLPQPLGSLVLFFAFPALQGVSYLHFIIIFLKVIIREGVNIEAHCIWQQPLPNFESSLHSRVRIRQLRTLVMWCCGNMYFSTRTWFFTHSYGCKSGVAASNQLNATRSRFRITRSRCFLAFFFQKKGEIEWEVSCGPFAFAYLFPQL